MKQVRRKNGAEMSERYHIAAIGKALDVLEALGDRPLTLSELSERLRMPRSSLFRILATLASRGYVEHGHGAEGYVLGLAAVSLAGRHPFASVLRRVAHPVLEDLARAVGETANLGMLLGTEIVYVDMVEGPYAMRMNVDIGSRSPAHSTSLGKALLAFAGPEAEVEALLPGELPAKTARTITSRESFIEELRAVRERGWSLDDEETEPGARCVGASVLNSKGHAVAAVSVAGPVTRISDARPKAVAACTVEAARRIARFGGCLREGIP